MSLTVQHLVLIFLSLFLVWILISIVLWSIWNGISPTPTSPKAKKKLLQAISSNTQGIIYELGSGWGTLTFAMARKCPKAHVIGYETSPFPLWYTKIIQLFVHLENLSIKRRDFYKVSLSDATLVVCYLYPGAMRNLREKFRRELKPGTLVISNTFAIPGWQPAEIYELDDIYKTKIYLYHVPTTS